jgi:sugar O-acyltransferase (sialic acid O-acetyltransferase NeuD family)
MTRSRWVKSGLDRCFAVLLILVLAPLMALVALAIGIDSRGGPLFLQERIGLGGRPFTIFKFRTMVRGAERRGLGNSTAVDDDRITRVGRVLRALSLDELPQLFNIALGEMSFIGPRPTLRYQVEAYSERQRRRLLARPGITGWAQVNGRNDIPWSERIEHDLYYIDHASLGLDLRILWRTLVVCLRGSGVYADGRANDGFVEPGEPRAAGAEAPAGIAAVRREPLAPTPADVPAPEATAAGASGQPTGAPTPGPAPSKVAGAPTRAEVVGADPAAAAARPTAAEATAAAPDDPTRRGRGTSRLAPAFAPLPLLIVGAGGHARVLIDIAEKQARYRVVGLIDEQPCLAGTALLGYPVLGGGELLHREDMPSHAIVAIGAPEARAAWQEHLEALGFQLAVLVHPSAQVGRDVRLGAGTVLMAGTAVNPGTRLGRGVIVNTGASIDHDCEIGDFVHVAPGARLAGGVRVGSQAHVGIGACVIQNVAIGAGAVVGAGAAVVRPVPDGLTVVGVPARPLPQRAPRPRPEAVTT